MEQVAGFMAIALGILVVFMGLCVWWAFRSYKSAHWVRFTFALVLFVILGFGWNYFPLLVWMILAPIFGWSFS